MQNRKKVFAQWCLIGAFTLLVAFGGPACQCGVNLISPMDWGKRLLNTDLPDHTLEFPDQFTRGKRVKEFLLFNDGKEKLTVASVTMVGSGKQAFRVVKAPQTPFVLMPGQDKGVKISVEFSAQEAGSIEASIAFFAPNASNTDENDNFFVKLKGVYRKIGPEFLCGEVLDYEAVEIGKRKILECEVSNRGNAALLIKSARYVSEKGGKNIDFSWVEPGFPITIAPGNKETIKIRIAYSPSDYPPVEDEGAFVFETNLPIDSEESKPRLRVIGRTAVALIQILPLYPACDGDESCQKIDARLSCLPDKIGGQQLCQVKENELPLVKFPYTRRGKTTTRSFLIRSIGEVPLKVSKLFILPPSTPEFSLAAEYLKPFTLDPKQEKIITIAYTPRDLVEDKETLRVVSNDVEKPVASVLLEATPTGCDLEATPLELIFKTPLNPSKPEILGVTLTNFGNAPCELQSISIKSGLSDPFTLASLPTEKYALGPNAKLEFLVEYRAYGRREIDFAVIKSDDPDQPEIEVKLVPPNADPPRCALEAAPPLLNFNQVSVGLSKTLSVVVTNRGQVPCVLSKLEFEGVNPVGHTAFKMESAPRLPINLPVGQNVKLTVLYKPPSQRSIYDGKLYIESNDPKEPRLPVRLIGTWGRRCLEVVPRQLDFGNTKTGCTTPEQEVTVYHLGVPGCPADVKISKVALAKGTTTEFQITKVPSLPFSLKTGQSFKVSLSYKTRDLGGDTGTLLIDNSVKEQSPLLVPLSGQGVSSHQQRDNFQQVQRPQTDILFVVDNSCSMREEQRSLAENFKSFISWASKLNVDYHIGVTTTDISNRSGNKPGCLRALPDKTGFLTPSTKDKESAFSRAVQVGTSGSPIEQGLEGAYRALSQPIADDPACNKGFYRKDASLSIIIISDEKDQSPQSLDFYVNYFKKLKGSRNIDLVRGSVVVGAPPSGCNNPGTGRATPSPNYWTFAQRLNGVQASICSTDWGGTLSKLGSVSFGFRKQFFLSRKPDVRTIIVHVGGKRIQEHHLDGWIYDSITNSILFSKSQTPGPGALITVDYQSLCL